MSFRRTEFVMIALSAIALSLTGCRPGQHGTVMEQVRNDTTFKGDPIPPEQADHLYEGTSEPTDYQGRAPRSFEVATRHDKIKKYRCTDCHSGGFVPDGQRAGPQKAHWGMELHHAAAKTMDCLTCHAPDKGMSLRTLSGDSVGWNKPYLLCSQCHFQQAQDWAIGAHGKRLGGWAGKRVVQNCTGCHNPHDPGFKSRMPAIEPMNSAPDREGNGGHP